MVMSRVGRMAAAGIVAAALAGCAASTSTTQTSVTATTPTAATPSATPRRPAGTVAGDLANARLAGRRGCRR